MRPRRRLLFLPPSLHVTFLASSKMKSPASSKIQPVQPPPFSPARARHSSPQNPRSRLFWHKTASGCEWMRRETDGRRLTGARGLSPKRRGSTSAPSVVREGLASVPCALNILYQSKTILANQTGASCMQRTTLVDEPSEREVGTGCTQGRIHLPFKGRINTFLALGSAGF